MIEILDRGAMLLGQLEALVEVARHGTVRRAADVLHVGQPALSARIVALEGEVGARLFDRTTKGMTLTSAGRALLPHAERAVSSVAAGIGHARDAEKGRAHRIVLGAAPSISAYVLPELMARLRVAQGGLRALVRTGHSEEIVALVIGGDVQVGLIQEIPDSRVVANALYQEELVMVVRSDHPFASERTVPVERLRDTILILFDRTSSYYDVTHSLFRRANVVPRGTIEVDNTETAKRMSRRGLGIAFLPSTAAADALADGSLVSVQVAGLPPMVQSVVAIERAGMPSLIPQELWALLKDIPNYIPGAHAIER